MNADAIRRIIEGAKPMIKQRKEPAGAADFTPPRRPNAKACFRRPPAVKNAGAPRSC
jgi:hypothetical protein